MIQVKGTTALATRVTERTVFSLSFEQSRRGVVVPLDPRSGPTFACYTHRDVGARAVRLEFAGELDMSTTPVAERALADVAEEDLALVVVDLRGLTFLGSSGLHFLLEADQRLNEAGKRLVIVQGARRVQRIFELTGTDLHLPLIAGPPRVLGAPGSRARSVDELRARDRMSDSPFISARGRTPPSRRRP